MAARQSVWQSLQIGKPVTSTGCDVAMLAVWAQAYTPRISTRIVKEIIVVLKVCILSPSFSAEMIEKLDEGPEISRIIGIV